MSRNPDENLLGRNQQQARSEDHFAPQSQMTTQTK